MRTTYLCFSILCCLFMFTTFRVAGAAERVISINFVGGSQNGNPKPMEADEVAGAVPKSQWNNASGNMGRLPELADDSDTPTGAALEWHANNIWSMETPDKPGNYRMMKGYLDTENTTTTTVTVSNLPESFANKSYDVYVYFNGATSETRRAKYSLGSVTITAVDPDRATFSGKFIEAVNGSEGNYVCFRDLKDRNFTLLATPDQSDGANAKRAPVNAIQIVSGKSSASAIAAKSTSNSAPATAPDEDTVSSRPAAPSRPESPARASAPDRETAAAYAASAAKLATDGKPEKAKELCYAALAQDENCPEALYELGKIFEKDGNSITAADFLVRAGREFGKGEGANPALSTKRLDAERRVQNLNPYAMRLATTFAEYTAELNAITKKSPDTFTLEEACDRVDALKLRAMLPPDKAPKFDRPSVASAQPKRGDNNSENGMRGFTRQRKETVVTPEVERALKAAGWKTITGTWVKKSEQVYEVTDGTLQADYVNGALQVLVLKGGTGRVKAMVRNSQDDYSGSYYSYGSGFGITIKGMVCKLYSPSNGMLMNSSFLPFFDRDVTLADAPKNHIFISVNEGNLDIKVNNKTEHRSNYKIGKEGPFLIQVDGTATIESPMAKGL